MAIGVSGFCVGCVDFVALAKNDADRRRGPLPESDWNVKGVWKRVLGHPATYIPTDYPVSAPREADDGRWVVDPRDGKRFFVPNTATGGLTPAMLEAEALKMTEWPPPRPIIVMGDGPIFAL